MEATVNNAPREKKQRMWPYYLVGSALMYMAIASFKYFTAPHSYEECVMKNIQSGDSDTAASIKSAACRNMFPKLSVFDVIDRESRSQGKTTP